MARHLETSWTFPTLQRKVRSEEGNYRGINLIPQMPRVVECTFEMCMYCRFLVKLTHFDNISLLTSAPCGYRNALALIVFTWSWAIGSGKRLAVYSRHVAIVLMQVLGAWGALAPKARQILPWPLGPRPGPIITGPMCKYNTWQKINAAIVSSNSLYTSFRR